MIGIHRFIYEYYHGTICPDLTIDHLCKNKKCGNPLHLEEVTQRENTLRGNKMILAFSQKTHCPQGHPYDKENTIYRKTGGRKCKACSLIQCRDYKRKLRKLGKL